MLNRQEYPSLSQGLVGAWCCSLGASGLTLIDRSGRNNHGALTNMAGQNNWRANGSGVALNLDGTDDFVSLRPLPSLNATTSASVLAWASLTNITTATRVIFSQKGTGTYDSRNDTFEFGVSGSGFGSRWYLECGNSSVNNGWREASSAIAAVAGRLYHVAGTYDGSNIRIYVDGVLSGTTASTQLSGTQNTNCFIGLSSLNSGTDIRRFNGIVDDVRVYNRALTPAEIRLLASRRGIGLSPLPDRAAGLPRKLSVNVGGDWRPADAYVHNGTGFRLSDAKINVAGVWK